MNRPRSAIVSRDVFKTVCNQRFNRLVARRRAWHNARVDIKATAPATANNSLLFTANAGENVDLLCQPCQALEHGACFAVSVKSNSRKPLSTHLVFPLLSRKSLRSPESRQNASAIPTDLKRGAPRDAVGLTTLGSGSFSGFRVYRDLAEKCGLAPLLLTVPTKATPPLDSALPSSSKG